MTALKGSGLTNGHVVQVADLSPFTTGTEIGFKAVRGTNEYWWSLVIMHRTSWSDGVTHKVIITTNDPSYQPNTPGRTSCGKEVRVGGAFKVNGRSVGVVTTLYLNGQRYII